MMTDLQATIGRIRAYVASRKNKPILGLDDVIHAVHTGSEHEGELRLSDIDDLLTALEARGGPVACRHEWYQGVCAHCELPASEYRALIKQQNAVKIAAPVTPGRVSVPVEPTEEVQSLNRECNELNDRCIAQGKLIEDLATMCRRLSYAAKRDGRDALALQCVQLLKKHNLGGSVIRTAAAQEGKC